MRGECCRDVGGLTLDLSEAGKDLLRQHALLLCCTLPAESLAASVIDGCRGASKSAGFWLVWLGGRETARFAREILERIKHARRVTTHSGSSENDESFL